MSNKNKVVSLVLMQLSDENIVSENKIIETIDAFSLLSPLSKTEKEEVLRTLHSKLSIKMDIGVVVKSIDHKSWYYNAKTDIEPLYWERYRSHLIQNVGLSSKVISSLDASTDKMMDLLGNPKSGEEFNVRGLVIGDVQSGKTSTYIGLINKASDAGYKIIILLTGTIEKLRRQTQSRLDEGFVGLDSTAFTRDRDNVYVGVGKLDPSITAWAVTSTSSDFNTSTASKLNGKLSSINDPILFVLKKNKSVLEKLEQWLRIYNANHVDKKIHLPLLLIDDEADNASVNTRSEENPTVINDGIRKLLKLFTNSNYIGFTATPYANIFINPDSNHEMLKDDLFPRDFIYSLDPPTNYIGARDIFDENNKYYKMVKGNDDCEKYLPLNHKIDADFNDIPPSLEEAILSFMISNALRDLRGHKNTHRSMLINVSRFISVQNKITITVDDYVRNIQRQVRNYYKTGEDALKLPIFIELYRVFLKFYSFSEFSWVKIQSTLSESISSIVVRTVNGGNAPKTLNYDEFEETGLRIIAIGGYSLSRGLTLEGLCISYFFRNSQMYDTLMQMGRWFGYRDNYADLCQIWMSDSAKKWYVYISEASDELRNEIRIMDATNKTPFDFGLCVRSDISTLYVTARNKMKTAKNYERNVTLSGKVFETPYLHLDEKITNHNKEVIENFLSRLIFNGYNFANNSDLAISSPQILNVDKSYILELLSEFKSHKYNVEFNTSDLISFIDNPEYVILNKWDIALAQGDGNKIKILDIEINSVLRKFDIKDAFKALQLSGSKLRLGTTTFAKAGLTKRLVSKIEEIERIKLESSNKNVSFYQNTYFRSGIDRNPLLVIYPVSLKSTSIVADVEVEDNKKAKIIEELGNPVYGLAIGIPSTNSVPNLSYKYKINLVKFRELFEIDNDDFEEQDDNFDEDFT